MEEEKQSGGRDLSQTLRQLLSRHIDDVESAGDLTELGLPPNVASAVGLSLVRRALKGEVTAIKFLRDTLAEEEPAVSVRAMDLSRLSDGELTALADRETGP